MRVSASKLEAAALPLWEYGLGLGFVRYYHYPASDQHNDLLLPFPTFQYRGEILKADDRDGARAYLIKKSKWSLDIGGGFLPALKSEDNRARKNMDPLLWSMQLGPQFVYEVNSNLHIKLGVYQSFITDFKFTKLNGLVYEQKVDYWIDPLLRRMNWITTERLRSKVSVSLVSGSRDYLSTYYEVESKDQTPDRAVYKSREGFLSYELGYFQSLQVNKFNFYLGFSKDHFNYSANRQSPLHRSDENLSVFIGINYMLGESVKRAVPEESSEGLLQKVKHRIDQKMNQK